MNILVTGSCGFIGKPLIRFLRSIGNKVIGIDKIDGLNVLEISEELLLSNNIHTIIHLAAQTSVWNDNLSLIEQDNIQAFIHIFQLAKKLDLKFIYASSSCSINVTSMYGLSKKFDDDFVELYGWDKCIGLRFHNVYGPNPRINTLAGNCVYDDKLILWNNGLNYRHFTFIDDVIMAIISAIAKPIKSGIYNVVNPEETSVIDFVRECQKYKQIDVTLIDTIRDLDKERQIIDTTHKNLLENIHTSIEDGIALMFKQNYGKRKN